MTNEINYDNNLGKGEVDSSILSGSTRNYCNCSDCRAFRYEHPAEPGRTPREHDATIRGKSVDSVHEKFAAAIDLAVTLCMDCNMHPVEMAEVLKRKRDRCP